MILRVSSTTSAYYILPNGVVRDSHSIYPPVPCGVYKNIGVSKVYISTPYGILTTNRLRGWGKALSGAIVRVGDKTYMSVGTYLVEITDPVQAWEYA